MKRLFYFAYGSNMLVERISKRLGKVEPYDTFNLKGYRLVFNCGYYYNSYANIIPSSQDHCVEGVLYELTQRQISSLNLCEGYPYNYEQQFFMLPNGHIGFAYVSVNELFTSKALPSIDYLNTIIKGALEHGLYTTYNNLVRYKDENYRLTKGNKYKPIK